MALGDLASDLQDDAEKRKNCDDLVDKIIAEFDRVKKDLRKLTDEIT